MRQHGEPCREAACLFYIRLGSGVQARFSNSNGRGWGALFTMSKVKSPTEKLRDRRYMYGECPRSSRKNIRRERPFVHGDSSMHVLVPWKPVVLVVLVWGLLSETIFFGFVASSVVQGKDPFAPGATITQPSAIKLVQRKGATKGPTSPHAHTTRLCVCTE
jgi:hypothetical protein